MVAWMGRWLERGGWWMNRQVDEWVDGWVNG